VEKDRGLKIFEIINDQLQIIADIEVNITDVLDDDIERFQGAYCRWSVEGFKVNATINLHTDLYKMDRDSEFKESTDRRFGNFLNNLGIELNEDALFVMTMIHEMAHVYYVSLFCHNDCLGEYIDLDTIAQAQLRLSFDKDLSKYFYEEIELSPYSTFVFSEAIADKYAIENFIPVWNKLKENGWVREELCKGTSHDLNDIRILKDIRSKLMHLNYVNPTIVATKQLVEEQIEILTKNIATTEKYREEEKETVNKLVEKIQYKG